MFALSLTHRHSLAHIHTHILSLVFSLSNGESAALDTQAHVELSRVQVCSLSHTYTQTHIHTQTLSLSLSLSFYLSCWMPRYVSRVQFSPLFILSHILLFFSLSLPPP